MYSALTMDCIMNVEAANAATGGDTRLYHAILFVSAPLQIQSYFISSYKNQFAKDKLFRKVRKLKIPNADMDLFHKQLHAILPNKHHHH